MRAKSFQHAVLRWYDAHGRKTLPWQQTITPYRVWLSEVMLQQTQVATVIPYFKKFLAKFPTIDDLARAELDEVLHLWAGLGYYTRARNLYKTACLVHQEHDGQFPTTLDGLIALPGIGRSTAGAILSLSMEKSAPILDGNVKRILTRAFCIEGWPDSSKTKKLLWEIATEFTPTKSTPAYTQAMMDIGALICTRTKPACHSCPLAKHCQSFQESRQSEFPHKKPKKSIPTKEVRLFLLINEKEELLLVKRPPTGIWGGLWSLPETTDDGLDDAIVRQHGVAVLNRQTLPSFRHTFTHFHLNIHPICLRVKTLNQKVMSSEQVVWYQPGRNECGLPKPVQKLVDLYLG